MLKLIPDDTIPNPASVMTDLEKAAIKTFTAHFPQANVSGCYFQPVHSAWRRTQELRTATKYREDLALILRVPPPQVHDYIAMIIDDEPSRRDGILKFHSMFLKHICRTANKQPSTHRRAVPVQPMEYARECKTRPATD